MFPYFVGPPVLRRNKQKRRDRTSGGGVGDGAGGATTATAAAAASPEDLESLLGTKSGGPIQHAAYEDLKALRAEFRATLLNRKDDDGKGEIGTFHDNDDRCPDHVPPGRAFAAFKAVFGAAKVAALHTRFFPVRGDRGGYVQLLYAACLVLLREASSSLTAATAAAAAASRGANHRDNDKNDDDNNSADADFLPVLEDAAYAVFCLYALYETNPLEDAPTHSRGEDEQKLIGMLPMGLESKEHPPHTNVLYRRAFRAPIRIDAEHYGLLCQLREIALAQRADCQARLVHQQRASTMDEDALPKNHQNSPSAARGCWSCRCSVATDSLRILNRLADRVDLCSYTGPCGLEALAGHPDYYPDWTTNTAGDSSSRASAAAGAADPEDTSLEELLTDNDREPFSLSGDLETNLQGYLDSCAAIRLPPPSNSNNSGMTHRRRKRIHDALLPVFSSSEKEQQQHGGGDGGSGGKDVAQLIRAAAGASHDANAEQSPKRVKIIRHVTFGGGVIVGTSVASFREHSAHVQEGPDHESQQTTGKGSALPPEDEPPQHEEETHSLEFVLPAGLSDLQQQSVKAALECIVARDASLLLPTRAVGASKASVAGDEVSALGAGGVSVASTATGVGRSALRNLLSQVTTASDVRGGPRRKNGVSASDAFLEVAEQEDESVAITKHRAEVVNLDLSDLSSEEDAISVAASAVGQRALSDLLAMNTDEKEAPATRRQRKKRKRVSTAKKPGRKLNQSGLSSDEDASSVAASAVGRNALSDLLARSTNE